MAYTKYSLTPANNTAAPPDGAPEGMLPSAVNDTMRDMMAQIRDCGDGIRDGTYTMTAPKITGGTITGAAFTGNTFTSPVISGGTINNATIGATTATTGKFTTLEATGVATFSAGTAALPSITTTGDTNTGIFFPAADTIAFTEGGVESMRIDSSGNVGIGTSSPARKFDVTGTGRVTGEMLFGDDVHLTNDAFVYSSNGGSGVRAGLLLDGTNQVVQIRTSATERMRIDSSGDVGINNTGLSGCRFGVSDDGSIRNAIGVNNTASGSGSQAFVSFQRNTTQTGSISNTNSATAYNTSSDYRLKENIAPMTGALAKVAQLKPVTYTWKVNGFAGQGFIAHELQEIVPDCVSGAKDAVETYTDEDGNEQTRIKPQGVDTSFLVATLTAAIQELKAELDATKAEVQALKGTL